MKNTDRYIPGESNDGTLLKPERRTGIEQLFCFIDGNLVKVDQKQEGHSHIVVKFTRSGIPYAVLIV